MKSSSVAISLPYIVCFSISVDSMFIGNFITRVVIFFVVTPPGLRDKQNVIALDFDLLFYGCHYEFDSTHGNKNK